MAAVHACHHSLHHVGAVHSVAACHAHARHARLGIESQQGAGQDGPRRAAQGGGGGAVGLMAAAGRRGFRCKRPLLFLISAPVTRQAHLAGAMSRVARRARGTTAMLAAARLGQLERLCTEVLGAGSRACVHARVAERAEGSRQHACKWIRPSNAVPRGAHPGPAPSAQDRSQPPFCPSSQSR